MRRRRGDAGKEADIPVSSFSDIAFLLIIFFVLTTTLVQLRGIKTDVPAGEKSDSKPEKTTVVGVHDNRLSLNEAALDGDGTVTPIQQLRERLAAMELKEKTGNDKVVLLETSGEVEYELYYQVMTAISTAGGAIAMVEPEE